MPLIQLTTVINAPIERCFDLARSIDLHKLSTGNTNEEAIAGVTSGLIGIGETVTWRAKHFGIRQSLTSKITALEYPFYFRDEMLDGIFKKIEHDHRFEKSNDCTLMKDYFEFESPLGFIGRIVNELVLKSYLKNLLIYRNQIIKEMGEGDGWIEILKKGK